MAETKIPGIKGKHRWITDNCLAQKGVRGSIDEAVEDARRFLLNTIPLWSKHPGVRFHVVVTVEAPSTQPKEGTDDQGRDGHPIGDSAERRRIGDLPPPPQRKGK